LRVGFGVGVEDPGIAAEGAQDVGGGFVAGKEVRWGLGAGEGVPDEAAVPDETRPSIEFYRRRDQIDLLLPIKA
jgi:hypothetical protein